jgi:hypothetical protein
MKRNKACTLALAATFVVCGIVAASCVPQAGAQTAASIAPTIKTRFEVLHMLYQSIQVRSLVDMREIHTFSYSPAIRDQMQNIFNAGGYQYGDKVEIWYKRGDSVALKIKGKPSKSN